MMKRQFLRFLVVLTLAFQPVAGSFAMTTMGTPGVSFHQDHAGAHAHSGMHDHTMTEAKRHDQTVAGHDSCGMHSQFSHHVQHCCSSAGCCIAIHPELDPSQISLTAQLNPIVNNAPEGLSLTVIDRPPIPTL